MEHDKKERRSFLKHLFAGSAVVAGAASMVKPAQAKTAAPVTEGDDEILYRETESFKKYYKSLRS